MAGRLDEIVVVDLEATCWEDSPIENDRSEIIQIGICTLSVRALTVSEPCSILVRPVHSEVSTLCTNLTGIRPEDAARGVSLARACAQLEREFSTRTRTWASFGDYDRRLFERQCSRDSVENPFGPTHINVKNLAAVMLGLDEELSFPKTMRAAGLVQRGLAHRADVDAWNTSLLLGALLRRTRVEAETHDSR